MLKIAISDSHVISFRVLITWPVTCSVVEFRCVLFSQNFNSCSLFVRMNRVLRTEVSGPRLLGVQSVFSLISRQGKLTHEQRLELKKSGRPCPKVTIKNRSSETVYDTFPWICGDEEKNTFFCWPCLIMGDLSKVRKCLFFIIC